jgi:hypothetical protein
MQQLSLTTLNAMKDWLSQCIWSDIDSEEISDMPVSEIIGAIKRHYAGGVAQFLKDS